MTNQQHPITPPPELVQQWIREKDGLELVVVRAAEWGADTELEACLRHLDAKGHHPTVLDALRAARRPKPPSLKEQAIRELGGAYDRDKIDDTTYDTIRRALEALPDD
jgi:hypothetical protein